MPVEKQRETYAEAGDGSPRLFNFYLVVNAPETDPEALVRALLDMGAVKVAREKVQWGSSARWHWYWRLTARFEGK